VQVISETLRVANLISGVFRRANTDIHFKGLLLQHKLLTVVFFFFFLEPPPTRSFTAVSSLLLSSVDLLSRLRDPKGLQDLRVVPSRAP
jgi:hypothetical protein